MESAELEEELTERVGRLTLSEKVRLLTGRDFWTTCDLPSIGLRSMVLSDGPSGVRGETWDERSPSLNLPSTSTLASSWDETLAESYGRVCASEALRKNVDIILGPTVNLHRSPYGGRNFESFSEDPILTARLAAAYVRGVQGRGVAATPKHYVANDFETDRFTVNVTVEERPLRELYLRAFEDAIVDAGAWAVMSAYNSVNGTTMTENNLLETPLRTEWHFDGVIISDWSAVRSLDSALTSQDLVMPGPSGPWGAALKAAISCGDVPESVIDQKVVNILRLAARVGALQGDFQQLDAHGETLDGDGVLFVRSAAVEGMVLLTNDGILPLDQPVRIAVIGHNARESRTQGGGSATVVPEHVVSALDGIRAAFPDADISYSIGAVVQEELSPLVPADMVNPVTGESGAQVTLRDANGISLLVENRQASNLAFFSGAVPLDEVASIEFLCTYTPAESRDVRLGFAGVGAGRLIVDGRLLVEDTLTSSGPDLGAAFLAPPASTRASHFTAGVPQTLQLSLAPMRDGGSISGALSFTVGTEPLDTDPTHLIVEAADAASIADVAVVVVGTNSRVESEGHDREDLRLPGRQDDLVDAVINANRNTVVVVNAGAPVLMPWRDAAAATLVCYFPGQEFGHALGDVLNGTEEPGGRLPTTWPLTERDLPIPKPTPTGGTVDYDEGLQIGYKAWLRGGQKPAFPFGHGLGYTSWGVDDVRLSRDETGITISAMIENTGVRSGKQVLQAYCERLVSRVERPYRWLIGFQSVRLEAGTTTEVQVRVKLRDLSYWDQGWTAEPGDFTIKLGWSSENVLWTGVLPLTSVE